MKKLIRLFCLLLLAQVVSASVIYSFSGTDTAGPPFPPGPFTFTLTLSTLITSDLTDVVPGATLTCSACSFVSMLPSHPGSPATDTRQIQYTFPSDTSFEFYFAPGSFEVPGVYHTILLLGLNDATLTVMQDGVPEPSSAVLLVLGFGVIFLLRATPRVHNDPLGRSFLSAFTVSLLPRRTQLPE
jgi:hypothetical protein